LHENHCGPRWIIGSVVPSWSTRPDGLDRGLDRGAHALVEANIGDGQRDPIIAALLDGEVVAGEITEDIAAHGHRELLQVIEGLVVIGSVADLD
jgi:hypothetical protein